MSFGGKVVYLLPGFPSDESDENCFPFIQDFLIELIEKPGSRHVSAIGIHYPFRHHPYDWHGIKAYAIGGQNRKGIARLGTWYLVMKTLYRIYRNDGIDIIHAFWLNEPAFLAQIFSFFFAVRVVVTVPGQDAKKTNKYLPFLNLRKIHVSGLSRFVIDELRKHKKLYHSGIIPSGIGTHVSPQSGTSVEGFDILGVGNIHPLKNFGLFLDVVGQARMKRPEITAAIIGHGQEEVLRLKEKCRQLDLEKNVRFLGELHRRQVLAIMLKSKVFLHTSDYEGQCFAFTEALSQGMYVVATPVADNRSITAIRTGNNKDELAALVNEGLANFSRKVVLLKSAKETADDYLELYHSLTC